MKPQGVFVVGTDTGVGKTEASCALLSLMAEEGWEPAPFKPYESGCPSLEEPADARALMVAANSQDPLESVCPHRFRLPLAPYAASVREKRRASWANTVAAFRSFRGRPVVAEAAGGLLVPLDARHQVIDLVEALGLPVLLVARAGLGTLNHVGLSLEALRARRIPVLAVLLSASSPAPDLAARDNPRLIASRERVKVLGPVRFSTSASVRQARFRSAVAPLLPLLQRAPGR